MSMDNPQPGDGNELEGRKIPKAVVRRLSLYHRVLQQLEWQNVEKVSSMELGSRLGINPAKVRKDLAFFGQFGIPGFGYPVMELRKRLKGILGTDREISVILVGVGNLGSALLSYKGFSRQGFSILWGFDADPEKAKTHAEFPVPILNVEELEDRLASHPVDIAILAVPVEAAQGTANRLIRAGITAILNFVPVRLEVPAHVQVRYVDLSLELETLSYYLR